jgi:hypothetical protein
VYVVRQSSEVDRRLCQQTVQNRDAVRATWNAARMIFLARSENDEEINSLFDEVLAPIPPLECVDNKPVPKEG